MAEALHRDRMAPGHGRVAMVELFFDLVFVFAVTQLSHRLMEDFTSSGVLLTGFLVFAVWWVWIYTTWALNWLNPGRLPVRLCLFGLMLAGLVLSAAIPLAFTTRGLAFGGAYVVMQAGRGLFTAWALRGADARVAANFRRIAVWLLVSGVFWVAGGLAEPGSRLVWWTVALGLEVLGPWAGFLVPGMGRSTTADWPVDGHHMSERCGLFLIIALGESLLVTGATFSGLPWSAPIVGTLVVSFAGSVTMWWLYFDVAQELGTHLLAGSADPGRMARFTYTYMHLLIIAGVIMLAAADEFVLAHPTGHADGRTRAAIFGGTGLYLLGNLLFRWGFSGYWSRAHLSGLALVIALGLWATMVAPWALLACSTLVLLVVAAIESRWWARKSQVESRGHECA